LDIIILTNEGVANVIKKKNDGSVLMVCVGEPNTIDDPKEYYINQLDQAFIEEKEYTL